jgi:hypothetical protein
MNNTERYNKETEHIDVLMMGFYGNRTIVDMTREQIENRTEGVNLEHYILGILDMVAVSGREKFDTTIVSIPNTNNLVLIYNKYQEESERDRQGKLKPLVHIPQYDIAIYSRCAICRRGDDDKLYSIEPKDMKDIIDYLAE